MAVDASPIGHDLTAVAGPDTLGSGVGDRHRDYPYCYRAQTMICKCLQGLFDCEGRVRHFLGDGQSGRVALDELMVEMRARIWIAVSSKLQGKWRQDHDDVVQETLLKLCRARILGTWLDRQDRHQGAPFCYWVVVVAVRTALDWIRKHSRPPNSLPSAPGEPSAPAWPQEAPAPEVCEHDDSTGTFETHEDARMLRDAIIAMLSDSHREYQLVFCMKWSCLDPDIPSIAEAAGTSERTVYYRLAKMYESIARRFGDNAPSLEAVATALPGIRHPMEEHVDLSPATRKDLNARISRLLIEESFPIESRTAFYMKYSVLAPDVDSIAGLIGEDPETVRRRIEEIESRIRRLDGPDAADCVGLQS